MVRNVLGLTVGMTFPDANGVVRGVAGTVPGPGDTMLALREDPVRAGAAAGFDPIAFRVGTGGLTAWANHLDKLGINHTPPITALGIVPVIARRKTENGSGLGTKRWHAERSFAWLHTFKRLRTRYERRPDIHEALISVACSIICLRQLILN